MSANQWKEYFVFTKKERIGIITMLVVLMVIWFLPSFFSSSNDTDYKKLEAFKAQIASLQTEDTTVAVNNNAAVEDKKISTAASLFYFDPNTISQNDWQKLGLPDKTIATISNYLNKGGKFKKPEDLSKIYGLKKADYERLLPYIRITEVGHTTEKPGFASTPAKTEQRNIKAIDINTADTTLFIALPGIGSKLASRIINFRQKLGGFYSVDQIGEVYGIADTVFQRIRPKLTCDAKDIQMININSATLDDLKQHPYIKYQVANAVIQYRNQHGNYASVESLKQIQLITDEQFKKMAPYLSVH